MPRPCSVCVHPEREAINESLVAGQALRNIAERFGSVSVTALHRHRRDHLPETMVRAAEAAEVIEAGSLLDRLKTLNTETAAILREARTASPKNNDLALRAIARAEKQLELEARLLGELNEGAVVNVVASPEWVTMRTKIIRALEPFGDAKRAVLEALNDIGT